MNQKGSIQYGYIFIARDCSKYLMIPSLQFAGNFKNQESFILLISGLFLHNKFIPNYEGESQIFEEVSQRNSDLISEVGRPQSDQNFVVRVKTFSE